MRYRLGTTVAAAAMALCTAPANAAPADLDPSFGTGGVAQAAPGRVAAQGAPIVQPDGGVVVVGVSAGNVVVERFTAAGQPDLSFGTGGEIVTDITAPNGRVAVADAGGGAFHVAGVPAGGGGKVVLQRFTAAGGPASPKVTVNVPGSLSLPSAAVVAPDGSTYVANVSDCGAGVQCFGVLKFKGSGLDNTFGNGYVKTKVGSSSRPQAITLTTPPSDGKPRITVAGSVSGQGSAGSDTALVRYFATGALDTNFGTGGIAIADLSGTGAADGANGIVGEADGRVTVAGAAGAAGYVARFTPAGVADATFDADGIARDFAVGGLAYQANALARDGSGKYVVAGQTRDPLTATTRWTLSRLTGAGAFDTSFGTGGTQQYTPCSNTLGHGTSGVAASPGGAIHVAGSCGADGRVAVARVAGVDAFSGGLTAGGGGSSLPSGYERIRTAGLNPATVLGATSLLQETDLRASAIRPNPLADTAIRPNPLFYTAIRPNPLAESAIRPNPISSQILLSDFPLLGTTWEAVLAGHIDQPIQSLTLADVFALDPLPQKVKELSLSDIDLNRTPLRDVSAAAFLLSQRPLASLPAPAGGWCGFLEGQPLDCSNGASTAKTTLIDLELAGDDLGAYYEKPIGLATPTDLGAGATRAPLSYARLTSVDLARTPFGDVPARLVSSLLACGSSCTGSLADQQRESPDTFSSADLGALVKALPITDGTTTVLADVSLGQVLNGLVSDDAIPYEAAGLRSLLDAADVRPDKLQAWTLSFSVNCAGAHGLTAVVDTPGDARIVDGSWALTVGGSPRAVGAPVVSGETATFDLREGCSPAPTGTAAFKLAFTTEPGSELGAQAGTATVRALSSSISAALGSTVDDSNDPGSSFDTTLPLGSDRMATGHIADGSDVDLYTFEAPAPGSRVTFTLSHLPADYDLSIFGARETVEFSAIRPNPLEQAAIRPNPGIPDASREPTDSFVLAPDTVGDIAIRPNAIRPNPILRTNSIRRGREDEAATLVVRENDRTTPLTIAITPYNGASSPRKYVLRAKVHKAPRPPECLPRPALTTGSAPNTLPSAVDPDTRALILVNEQRLAARYDAGAAAELRARAEDLADATGGLVVPLDVPRTDGAYKAWDASPCSPEAANAVVAAVNGAVDAVRESGDGLRELRSILVVGSDEIAPQARVGDRTVLANEADFADDQTFDGFDTPQSRAGRLHYLLSDDPIGDFDPPQDGFYVPDVALGRLLETPAQMLDQIDAFLSPQIDGRVRPVRSFVTGYDFLTDGSEAVHEALTGAVPPGSAEYLISEEWTALQAEERAEVPGAAFASLNGHYDQYRGLSAAGNVEGSPDVFSAFDVTPPSGSVLFTVGCHAGLNLAFSLASPDDRETRELGDWAEKMSAAGSLFTGNTGYGYGDTEAVAYSEKLMAEYARNLVAGTMSSGQALTFAKQESAAQLTSVDAYWQKASMEATFYGIPMYKVGPDGSEGGSALPPDPPPASAPDTRYSTSFDIGLNLERRDTDRGSYWAAALKDPAGAFEDPLVIQNRPVQPKVTIDVTPPDEAPVHGALLEALETTDVDNVDPVIARPTIDLSANEPEPSVGAAFFPAQQLGISPEETPEGRRTRLTLVAGQTRDTVQRLVTSARARVFRSHSTDWKPPTIAAVSGSVVGDVLTVTVDVVADDGVGGVVLFRTTGDAAWRPLNLRREADGHLRGSAPVPAGTTAVEEATVSIHDSAGNTADSANKGFNFPFAKGSGASPPDTSGPAIAVEPASAPNEAGWYRSAVEVRFTCADAPSGVASCPLPIELGNGESSTVTATDRAGNTSSVTVGPFKIDAVKPSITGSTGGATPSSHGWYKEPVSVSWDCRDALSGIAFCSGSTLVGEGDPTSVTGTARDEAGNEDTATIDGLKVDSTAPTIAVRRTTGDDPAAPDQPPNVRGWYKEPVTIRWDCVDALSGIDGCPEVVTIDDAQEKTLSGTARDRAGNESPPAAVSVSVDDTEPSATITSGPILSPIHRVTGTASDAATGAVSGLHDIQVDYFEGEIEPKEEPARTYTVDNPDPNRKVSLERCDTPRVTCQWSTPAPSLGEWTVVVHSVDGADNRTPADERPRKRLSISP